MTFVAPSVGIAGRSSTDALKASQPASKPFRSVHRLCVRGRRPTVIQRFAGKRGRVVAGASVLHTVPSAGRVPCRSAASTALPTHVLMP